ncbi:MAG: DUF4160 domain-containing protein [Holophagaceae bacterium]|nr:DUF4160 domain-containing protein [Holophagaceae bacterium]
MPTLSLFYGIIISMHREDGTQHHIPHIHAESAEHEASISLDNEILAGSLPKNKLRLVEAWIEIHREDLLNNWLLLQRGLKHFAIDPLK